jgi:hypothetical protein
MTKSMRVPLLLSSSSSPPWFDGYADSRYDDSDQDDDDDDMDAMGSSASARITGPFPFRTRYQSYDDDDNDDDDDDDDDTDSVWLACLASVHSLSTHNDANHKEDPIVNNVLNRDEKGDKNTDDDDDDENARWCAYYQVWSCLASGLLWPLLLWLQFAVAWRYPLYIHSSHGNDVSSWASVQSSIVCFVLASILYRYSLNYHSSCDDETRPQTRATTSSSSWLAIGRELLAELCTNVILGLVLFQHVHTALAFMHVATLLLVLAAVLASTCSCTVRISNEPSPSLSPRRLKVDHSHGTHDCNRNDSDQVYGMLNITIV